MSVARLRFYCLMAGCFLFCTQLVSSAQNTSGLRLDPHSGPTYPGASGLPALNINDARPGINVPMPSGSATQILQQNFPVSVKGSDADTFMPAGLLEKSLGPLSAPRKETHIY